MTEEKDFEAIGRYTDASERVHDLSAKRHSLARDIVRVLNGVVSINTLEVVGKFDTAEIVKKAEELEQINIDLEVAIGEMNAYAVPAGRKPLRRA